MLTDVSYKFNILHRQIKEKLDTSYTISKNIVIFTPPAHKKNIIKAQVRVNPLSVKLL